MKTTNKSDISNIINQLQENIITVEYHYNYDDIIENTRDIVSDYMNETQDRGIEELYYSDIITYDELEDRTKYELENGGLYRLNYFLQGIDRYENDYYRINAYGNASNIDLDDITNWIENLIEYFENKIEEYTEEN